MIPVHCAHMALPSGSLTSSNTVHSCSCRGLAPSNEIAAGLALSTSPMIVRSGMSLVCGPS